MKDLKIGYEMTKTRYRETLQAISLGKDLLVKIPKTQATKAKVNK